MTRKDPVCYIVHVIISLFVLRRYHGYLFFFPYWWRSFGRECHLFSVLDPVRIRPSWPRPSRLRFPGSPPGRLAAFGGIVPPWAFPELSRPSGSRRPSAAPPDGSTPDLVTRRPAPDPHRPPCSSSGSARPGLACSSSAFLDHLPDVWPPPEVSRLPGPVSRPHGRPDLVGVIQKKSKKGHFLHESMSFLPVLYQIPGIVSCTPSAFSTPGKLAITASSLRRVSSSSLARLRRAAQ